MCWPTDALRRLVEKSVAQRLPVDDYEVHVAAVAECGQRNRLSELLQQDLDHQHAPLLRQFRQAKTVETLAQLWKTTVENGDAAGALWAALTHPRCDLALQEVICRNMHMYQHHAVCNLRTDRFEFNTLMEANASLAQELAKAQERNSRSTSEKALEIEQLNTLLVQARGQHIRQDSSIAFLNAELAALKTSVPALESSARLQKKIEQMASRQTELEAQLCDLRKKLNTATRPMDPMGYRPLRQSPASDTKAPVTRALTIPVYLHQKTVLCVGGRSGNLASYRDLVEGVGGKFSHHDGDLEDNQSVLDASLNAADMVICQTGCISHNAYWKVKDFCKRTGKRCVFVENPSSSALARSLANISSAET